MAKPLTRSIRIKQLYDFLALKTPGGGATLEEIMAKCKVSDRQVYRDLATLEKELEVRVLRPLKGHKTTGYYKLDEHFNLTIGPDIAAILFLSILRQTGSPLAPKTNEIKDTIIAALFKNQYRGQELAMEKLQQRVHIVEERLLDEHKSGEVVLKLMEAIKDNRVISMNYYTPSRGNWTRRVVEPYGLTSKHNSWYLVGYCRESTDRRTFRIDLIDGVHVLSEGFVYPEDFCLKSYFGDSWGVYTSDEAQQVLVKVRPVLAYRFKVLGYHPSQQVVEECPDGSILVSYTTSGIYEFIGWLLQWGELVEVLEPPYLRVQVQERLENMLKKYANNVI